MPYSATVLRSSLGAATTSVLSVALAVAAAHALSLQDSWWAAISAVMVVQENFGASFYRGVLRIVGTIFGALAAIILGTTLASFPVPFAIVMGLAAWGCLFAALVMRHSYAWVLMLITFVMIMCDAAAARGDLGVFAFERVANVIVGTAACVVVAGLMEIRAIGAALRHRHDLLGIIASLSGRLTEAPIDKRGAALHALQGAVAVVALSLAVSHWHLNTLAQGMVTTIAVLIVPLDTHAAAPRLQVTQRMLQRVSGCLLAGAVAFALFPLIEARPLLCQIALAVGVAAGASLQSVFPKARYVAIQFLVAFLMVFVQDQGWTVEEGPAFERLAGVAAGLLTLYVVFLFSSLAARRA